MDKIASVSDQWWTTVDYNNHSQKVSIMTVLNNFQLVASLRWLVLSILKQVSCSIKLNQWLLRVNEEEQVLLH